MAERVDVCVVGSGYGGSILAHYLAAAGQRTVVLERGARIPTEDLQLELEPSEQLRAYTYFLGNGITVLAGTVVGGGSIVYSGASLRAPSFVFERRDPSGRRIWPRELTRRSLDPFYARAEQGLGVHQLAFDEVAKRGGTWAQRMNRLGLRVDPMRQATSRCIHCGFCNTGCKFFRKNHLTLNYLLQAERAGAEVRPQMEAIQVHPADGGYRVTYAPVEGGVSLPVAAPAGDLREIQARRVVLAGGAIGTAGLLLRSRPGLPALSAQAGRNLSANGDLSLAAVLPADDGLAGGGRADQHQGVAMDTVCFEFLESHGFIIITQHLLSQAALLNSDGRSDRWWGLDKKHVMRRYGDQMLGLAVIGVDGSPGTVHGPTDDVQLSPAFGVSNIDFPIRPGSETERLFGNARRTVGDLVRRMGGEMLDLTFNISPSYEQSAYSAHPLGSARLADAPDLGVAGPDGQVHGHPGLYIADGAAVPTALGVNPSLTIAALAERIAGRLVRELGAQQAPPPNPNPLDGDDGERPQSPPRRRRGDRDRRARDRAGRAGPADPRFDEHVRTPRFTG
jgi:enediyne biosynthesis protein E9